MSNQNRQLFLVALTLDFRSFLNKRCADEQSIFHQSLIVV